MAATPASKSSSTSSLEREVSLGDSENLERLAKLSLQAQDRPRRSENRNSLSPFSHPSSSTSSPSPSPYNDMPESVSLSSSVVFSNDDSSSSSSEEDDEGLSGDSIPIGRNSFSRNDDSRESFEETGGAGGVGRGGGEGGGGGGGVRRIHSKFGSKGNSSKFDRSDSEKPNIIVVGIQLKYELAFGAPCLRLELDAHSMELLNYAVDKLAKKGDSIIGLYSHEPGKKLSNGKTEEDLPGLMNELVAAWQALAIPKKVGVEGRVTISDKAKPAFTKEAAALGADIVLLSCSFMKFVGKQLKRVHKWGDACISDLPKKCTIIVVRHGSIITSARGQSGKKLDSVQNQDWDPQNRFRKKLSYTDIEEATNYFGNTQLTRQGSSTSNVFLGNFKELGSGVVKRYKISAKALETAVSITKKELSVWTARNIPNFVPLYCVLVTKHYLVAVLDYVPQGCLYDNLHGLTSQKRLTWHQRCSLMLSLAEALSLLHGGGREGEGEGRVHGALQSANILLDANMEPLLTDYWMESLRSTIGVMPVFELPNGSDQAQGYIAPELGGEERQFPGRSVEGDVYAYGATLMEVVTGKRAYEEGRRPQFLHGWVKPLVRNKEYREITDSRLFSNYDIRQVADIIDIAMHCCSLEPSERPPMDEVVRKLEGVISSFGTSE